MNVVEAVQRAIVAKWTLDESLYFTEAPAGTDAPYAVFFLDGTWNQFFHGFTLQFNLFHDGRSSEGVNDFAELVKAAYKGQALTVSGFSFVGVVRMKTESIFKSDSGSWQATIIFEMTIN